MRNPVLVACGVLVLAVAAALLFGRGGTPDDASPEAGFARDMAAHHAQAVDMSFIIRDKDPTPEIRNLAYDIITTQSSQRGMFLGWLQSWGLSQVSDQRPMDWMRVHGHGVGAMAMGPDGAMPGMATSQEMTKLKEATGKQAEVLFLQLMIRHHEGGVEMAQSLLKSSTRPEVVSMAQKIITGQTSEIKLMTELLHRRGAQPLPSILPR
ncbi:DUF305 domain-containing protein [Nonomuraea maritima]|uniref:DUF305 domain-containing protein n=1 Tax=Nonomuraea maritima TaxID=683260 RepID=UPI001FE1DEF5|nr:DUF305 domain-containing protein [Nonomuraea maritima]